MANGVSPLPLSRHGFTFEKSPIPASGASAEAQAARKKLQAALDQMARVKPPKFNKFETDGRAAY